MARPAARRRGDDAGGETLDQSRLAVLVGYQLRRASLYTQQRFVEELAPHALTAAEFSVLVLLDSNRDVTQRRLCDALAVAPPNMVGLLERLQRRRLVERRRDDQDRRTWILRPTPAGARLVRRAERTVHALERRLFGGFDGTELATLRALLQRAYPGGTPEAPVEPGAPGQDRAG